MTYDSFALPINTVLPTLTKTLEEQSVVILQAEPGAGKTTQVPLHLLNSTWLSNQRILMLEPRRLAARTAARRMASQLGEAVGNTVGYRMQLDSRVSSKTRIEVITEGVLTRQLQTDPELNGIGLVIFDEFHERSLDADLGLMLCRESREGYRSESNPLRLLVMSATLDTKILQNYLNAALITCPGRNFPVTTHYLPNSLPFGNRQALFHAVTRQIINSLNTEHGSLLVFLPGTLEIRQVADMLDSRLPQNTLLTPLYGDLSQQQQDEAIQPAPKGLRKVVLATAIAESSLTIDGVNIVIDAGMMRISRFDPSKGMSQLETVRITADAAEQRRGRAGRLANGICYRMWTEQEQQQLIKQRRPEILEADLAPVVLELLAWGYRSPEDADWLSSPPKAPYLQALQLLTQLDATKKTDADYWQLKPYGQKIRKLPMHPRMAHMILSAEKTGLLEGQQWLACLLAALLSERDILKRDSQPLPADIMLRLGVLEGERTSGLLSDNNSVKRVRQIANKWFQMLGRSEKKAYSRLHVAGLLAAGWPDRVAKRRGSESFLLNSGAGATLTSDDPLTAADFLVAPALGGHTGQRNARIFMACEIEPEVLQTLFPVQINQQKKVEWDNNRKMVSAKVVTCFGALPLFSQPLSAPDPEAISTALIKRIRQNALNDLPLSTEFQQLQNRMICFASFESSFPSADTNTLLNTLEIWLSPWLNGINKLEQLKKINLKECLLSLLSWEQQQQLKKEVPEKFRVPSSSNITIDYSNPETPILQVKLQEMFGLLETPMLCAGRLPITFELLSPARRPVQKTQDLGNFWRSTYQDVKKELKGRYPKHYWPDDPFTAQATRHVRPR